MQTPLVSIIIPTYNRAHLIGETLDSVLAQTYTNWECIVVDDGSTDQTDEVLADYCKKDTRFQYHHRPKDRLPGGNAARNYGFEVSKGEYIQWFDSDDIMLPMLLKLKVDVFNSSEVDFVLSKSNYFPSNKTQKDYLEFEKEQVSFESFAVDSVNWGTVDFMLNRTIAEKVKFLEKLKCGQEYNFCCKMLLLSNKLFILHKVLVMVRRGNVSIGAKRKKNHLYYLETRFHAYWLNYLDIMPLVSNKRFEKKSLLICMDCILGNTSISLPKQFIKEVKRVFGLKWFYFILAIYSNKFFGKYYYFYNKLKS